MTRPWWAHPLAHDYQVRVAEFALLPGDGKLELPGILVVKQGLSTYINLDMGLGKTLITLMIQRALGCAALVFAPIRAVHNTWPEETDKWFPGTSYGILHGPDKDWEYRRKHDLYFINPEGLPWFEFLRQHEHNPAKMLVLDEGTMWKDQSTSRFKLMKRLRVLFDERIFILSGTANPQSYLDLWSQYFLLDGGKLLGTSYTRFKSRFFNQVDRDGYKFELKEGADEVIRKLIAPKTIRLDAIDHIKMPKLFENTISVQMPKKLYEQYKDLEQEYALDFLKQDITVEAFNAASLSSKLRQFVQGFLYANTEAKRLAIDLHTLKLDAAKEVLLTNETPFILAFEFKHEQEMIRDVFGDVPIVAGGTKESVASGYFKAWNAGDLNILAVQPGSVKYSLNLQHGGHNIMWLALPWSLDAYLQLIARLRRQGQKSPYVTSHQIIMEKTVDSKVVMPALINRRNVLEEFNNYFRKLFLH